MKTPYKAGQAGHFPALPIHGTAFSHAHVKSSNATYILIALRRLCPNGTRSRRRCGTGSSAKGGCSPARKLGGVG